MFSRPRAQVDRNANARRVAELITLRAGDPRRLTEQDYKNAGKRYGIEAAALHAFADVESATGGFAQDGRLMVLFEPHIFSRETGKKFDGCQIGGCAVSYPKWIPAGKGKPLPPACEFHPYSLDQIGRWGLIAFAAEMDFDAALRAVSWGAFQIMGFNHKVLGYPTPWHMACALYDGEHAHLDAAIRFLVSRDVLADMRAGRWRPVIRAWNGDGQVDHYLAVFTKRLDARRRAYA